MVDSPQPGDPAPGDRRPLSRTGNRPPNRFAQSKEPRKSGWDDEPDKWKDDWKDEKDDWPRQRKTGSSSPAAPGPAVAPLDSAYRMVGPVVMSMAIGYFLDSYLQTRPWWFLGMTFFGIVTGFWSMLKPLYFKAPPGDASPSDPEAPVPPPDTGPKPR